MIEYDDTYLLQQIERHPEWEARATADVARLSGYPFPENWDEELIRLRVYILCCLESLAASDDVFSTKLKAYQREHQEAIKQASLAARLAASKPSAILSVPILRG